MDDSTTRPPDLARGADGPETTRRVPSLTVLGHPTPSRIGQRAVLRALDSGAAVEISRYSPDFSAPSSLWDQEPLGDPFLSRRPWRLEPRPGGGLRLRRGESSIELWVDEEEAGEIVELDRQRLEAGVVLELAGRITLLLHRVPDPPPRLDGQSALVGQSEGLLGVQESVTRVAHLDVPVLLRGETGTGKELVAEELHRHSRRRGRPFVAVNLGALSPSLAPAELFGHAKGAFTGADQAREGLFRAADGGTLFLDEVGEAAGELQAMLLRVLETGKILPVGSQKTISVNVRLIAATDAPLEALAEQGDFRLPLLHRLAAYEIWLPTLRERREDIGRLFLHFAYEAAEKTDGSELVDRPDTWASTWLPRGLMARLARYHWPGNVRQLRNVVHQLLIDAQGRDQLSLGPRLERLLSSSEPAAEQSEPREASRRAPGDVSLEELEEALRDHRFEPAAAARRLGISRPSIYNLIREHPTLRIAEDLGAEEIRAALEATGGVSRRAAERLEVSARALGRRIRRDGLG